MSKFKAGTIVVCIDDEKAGPSLKKFNKYRVRAHEELINDEHYVFIEGSSTWWLSKRFTLWKGQFTKLGKLLYGR